MKKTTRALVFIALLLLGGLDGDRLQAASTSETACALAPQESEWLQRVLDAWSRVTREILEIPEKPVPWIVTFDDSCVFHLAVPAGRAESSQAVDSGLVFAGEPVPVSGRPHRGTIELPNGGVVPARAMAFASVWDSSEPDGQGTFFVLAMRSVWRRDHPKARERDLDGFFVGIASHEMVHTRQLIPVARRVEALRQGCDLPEDLGDTAIEELFSDRPEFAEALGRERDLLYRAARATEAERRRDLTRAALEELRRRRERFFVGERACLSELEDLLLVLEGTATWAHYRLALADPGVVLLADRPESRDRAEILEVLEAKDGEWVQETGFALFLLLDEMAPNWRGKVMGREPASPVDLLQSAVGDAPCGEPADGLVWTYEYSTDGGESWTATTEAVYSRRQ